MALIDLIEASKKFGDKIVLNEVILAQTREKRLLL